MTDKLPTMSDIELTNAFEISVNDRSTGVKYTGFSEFPAKTFSSEHYH